MKRATLEVVGALALGVTLSPALAGCAGPGEVPAAMGQVTAEEGFEEILGRHGEVYTKHGWNHYGPGFFELDPQSGVLTGRGGMGLFWYAARDYGDFVLELEFKCEDEYTNSGIFLRVPEVPVSDDYIYHSFEIQIDEAGEGIHGTGAVYDAEAPTTRAARPPGDWNRYRIEFVGNRIRVDLNGERVIDWLAEPRGKVADFTARGYIGLQNHDDRSAVYYRRIRVKEIETPH